MLVNIQMLRFIAALAVVMFHMAPLFSSGTSMFQAHLYGFAGVDVFFVISGFIMWYTTMNSHTMSHASIFLKRRFTRIFTGYWPYFLIAVCLFWWLDPGILHKKDIPGSFLLTPVPIADRLIPVSWTLTFELYFYLLFSLLLLIPRSRLPHVVTGMLVLLVSINLVGWSFLDFYSADFMRDTPRLVRILISPYVIEFLLGALLCHYATRGNPKWGVAALTASAMLFVLGAYLNGSQFSEKLDSGFYVVERVAIFGSAAVLLVYGAVALEYRERVLLPGASLLLGGASYSLYLSHTLIIDLFARFDLVQLLAQIQQWILWAMMLLVIVIYSVVHYLYIEKPFYALGKRLIIKRQRI